MSTRTPWSTWSPPRKTNSRTWRTTAASSTSLQTWAAPARTRWPSPGPSWAWAKTGRRVKARTHTYTPLKTLQIRAVQHLLLSLTAVSSGRHHVPTLFSVWQQNRGCSTRDKASHLGFLFIACTYSSVFGGVRRWQVDGRGGHVKDTATLHSALKERKRQPARLLCQNQTLTVNCNFFFLLNVASLETGTWRQWAGGWGLKSFRTNRGLSCGLKGTEERRLPTWGLQCFMDVISSISREAKGTDNPPGSKWVQQPNGVNRLYTEYIDPQIQTPALECVVSIFSFCIFLQYLY